jgi:hypothetical protein
VNQWATPTRRDLEKLVQVEGWIKVRDAQGRTGTHHNTYELELPDGRMLRTRISHPVDRSDIGASLFSHILRDQLMVDEATFWNAVSNGVKPDRGQPAEPTQSTPVDVVALLISRVGLSAEEIAAMGKDDAITRLNEFWATGK